MTEVHMYYLKYSFLALLLTEKKNCGALLFWATSVNYMPQEFLEFYLQITDINVNIPAVLRMHR